MIRTVAACVSGGIDRVGKPGESMANGRLFARRAEGRRMGRHANYALVAPGVALLAAGCARGVLDPQGPVASAERTILLNSLGIMLAVVVPTILATLAMAWWFRSGNTRATYRPEWAYSGQIELVVWTVPAMVVLLLGTIAWIGSHDLDPPRPLGGHARSVEVQVVSLDWKWLFIYPELGIASVNRLVVPAGTPVHFRLTSASVMNSFFVPQLGSQIYTMAGMATQLNLQADRPGRYPGLSAQYSGAGFADMRFAVDAVPPRDFGAWAAAARGRGPTLDAANYARLARRSSNVAPAQFGAVAPGLFDAVVAMRVAAPERPGTTDGRTKG